MKPDGVIIATGATPLTDGFSVAAPFTLKLPGVDQNNVLTTWDVLKAKKVGKNVLILDDDGTRHAAGIAQLLTSIPRPRLHVSLTGGSLSHCYAQSARPTDFGTIAQGRDCQYLRWFCLL